MSEKDTKTTWKSTQSEISKALDGWSTVSEEVKITPKAAPDEKMLKDIEGLIQIIKTKLEEFAPPPESSASANSHNHNKKTQSEINTLPSEI